MFNNIFIKITYRDIKRVKLLYSNHSFFLLFNYSLKLVLLTNFLLSNFLEFTYLVKIKLFI